MRLGARIAAVETMEKMTGRQIAAKARAHFLNRLVAQSS